MGSRLQLHTILCGVLGCPERGEECRVYFQPPSNTEMVYDCIRYERDRIEPNFADNRPYALHNRYQVTVIYRNPDSDLPKKIALLPRCSHDRHYVADNLHHDVFNLYF